MIFLADIGNTSITLGLIKSNSVVRFGRIMVDKSGDKIFYSKLLKKYANDNRIKITKEDIAIFCSVVPSVDVVFSLALKEIGFKKVCQTGKDLKYSIKNKYKKPKQVGSDRLLNAIAAHNVYPKNDTLVIDFGTAITFDIVNKKNEYLGGIIMPGIRTSLAALSSRAELLPLIKLTKPVGLIGKDTKTSIQNGIFYSVAGACEGIITRFKSKYGNKLRIIATGGDAALFEGFIKGINLVDKQLTLHGLYINYKMLNNS
jgi:type III pantothenate kinase